MEREKKSIGQKLMKILTKKVIIPKSVFTRVLIYIGLCGCLQFLIVGLIGVLRGYSVQGFWSEWIMLGSFFCLLFLAPPQKEKRKNVIFYIIVFTLMYSSIVGIAQMRYERLGKEYYEQGRYQEALKELKKEIQTWYLRLKYNTDEDNAMELMAKTYCQVGDFDKARDTYNLIIHRYPGFHGGRAEKYLKRLEDGLKIVAKYQYQPPGAKEDYHYLYDMARTYQYDLNCYEKALEVYRKIVDMDIRKESKKLAREQVEKLTVITQK